MLLREMSARPTDLSHWYDVVWLWHFSGEMWGSYFWALAAP
jgi:hypothetical protein